MLPKSNRAAELVDLVLNKVELNSASYRTFIKCLEEDQENNRQILEILNEAYATGKCEFNCMRRKVDSVFFRMKCEYWIVLFIYYTQIYCTSASY
jgi:transposase